jgi:hypothetical protein
MTDEHGDVALLIDWENLKWSLQQAYQAGPNISSLVEATREYGRVVLARAYAPWTNPLLAADAQNLYRAGIEPVYVPAHKNSADVRIAVDAADLCRQLEHVRTIVLVTGDYDLIHVLSYLRLNGRRAVVVGVGNTMAGLLAPAADAVLLYEQDIEPLAPTATPPVAPAPDATPPTVSPNTAIGWIEGILRKRSGGQPYSLNRIGQALRDRYQFSARQSCGVSLKELMQRAGNRFHFTTDGATDYASLTPPSAPSLDPASRRAAKDDTSKPPQPVPRVDPFDVLVPTLRKVRQQQALAYFPMVQQALEARIGSRLRDIGHKRLTDFFREAERRGLVQTMHLPNGSDILLWPGEAPPGAAPVAVQADPPRDAPVVVQPAQRVVFEELDNEARQAVVRIIAAVEDRAREQGGAGRPRLAANAHTPQLAAQWRTVAEPRPGGPAAADRAGGTAPRHRGCNRGAAP